ncbi:MAG: hydrolase [Eubacteriales bacterium]|nr:hydrolase [Eubacteriales bacterium]
MTPKEQFIETYCKNIHRPGADKLLAWMESTDFFTAPASTRFHAAYEGGLLEHSLNVYNVLISKHYDPAQDDLESFTLVSLLHDLCKAGFYTVELRNRKNDAGVWEKVPVYAIDDKFPYGHGEKSVFLIERFLRLKNEEAVAIRWHMGGFDDAAKAGSFAIAHAFEKYPLAVKLHLSDLEATYLCENRGE